MQYHILQCTNQDSGLFESKCDSSCKAVCLYSQHCWSSWINPLVFESESLNKYYVLFGTLTSTVAINLKCKKDMLFWQHFDDKHFHNFPQQWIECLCILESIDKTEVEDCRVKSCSLTKQIWSCTFQIIKRKLLPGKGKIQSLENKCLQTKYKKIR